MDSGEVSDITSTIVENSGVWEATKVGNYSISAWAISNAGYNISETVTVSVTNGKSVTVDIDVIANTAKAGDVYTLTITGTDADGNTFLESVLWTKDNKPVAVSEIEDPLEFTTGVPRKRGSTHTSSAHQAVHKQNGQ